MMLSLQDEKRACKCGKNSTEHGPYLEIVYESPSKYLGKPFEIFSKYVKVFDLYFIATEASEDDKLLHGASVFYQYIDNDADGFPDNVLVYNELVKHRATMTMFKNQEELEKHADFFDKAEKLGITCQDLESEETRPGSIKPYSFDEALEEVFHLLCQGYVFAYPEIFGLHHGSTIANAMDKARGGYFPEIPTKYPDSAWYTYYDPTCDYSCQIMEYWYWAMTSLLGAQALRKVEVYHEWKLNTPEKVRNCDLDICKLLLDPVFKFPAHLPSPCIKRTSGLDCGKFKKRMTNAIKTSWLRVNSKSK